MRRLFALLFSVVISSIIYAQNQPYQGKFEPIDNMITPPNVYRSASGAPGKAYWQQRADYKIKAQLDEKNNILSDTKRKKKKKKNTTKVKFNLKEEGAMKTVLKASLALTMSRNKRKLL